jgi:ribosomal protein S18 acetylase RimI-like enzyme
MTPVLPKLFFLHFEGTSFVAEDADGKLVAFLIGFLSQTDPDEAYIHFVGVAPEQRGSGVGRKLYERFFEAVRAEGRGVVRCVTSPSNTTSIAFHEAMGFGVDRVAEDYDGPGEDRVLFVRRFN